MVSWEVCVATEQIPATLWKAGQAARIQNDQSEVEVPTIVERVCLAMSEFPDPGGLVKEGTPALRKDPPGVDAEEN